jgi:ribosomal protein S18 acetylase RimI-like enzyme
MAIVRVEAQIFSTCCLSMIEFRPATLSDADAIAAMHADNWRATYRGHMQDAYLDGNIFDERRQLWRERMTAPPAGQVVLLALEHGDIVGFSCMIGNENQQWGSMLDNLHVSGSHKGRGIGEQLIRETARRLNAGYPGLGMYLWVLEANEGARRFYHRLGAINAERDTWSPPDGSTLPCLRYAWPDLSVLL